MNLTEDLLSSLATKCANNIYYYPNGGNAGDALINMGFYSLAKKTGLRYRSIGPSQVDELRDGDVVIVAGGGTLVPEWTATPNFLRRISGKKIQIIILPQSIRQVDDVMMGLPAQSIVVCREKYSADYCSSLRLDVDISVDDDMAFHVDVQQILRSQVSKSNFNWKNMIRDGAFIYHKVRSNFTKKIDAFRCDDEKNKKLSAPRRLVNDLSIMASLGAGTYDDSLRSAKRFLQIIDLYDVVTTDRLHVGIASCLMGKKVILHNNNYYKLQGVFEKSMAGRYTVRMAE
ncbi:polysaccharide pyruvyl transferase family protein [Variovorax sp. J2P1-59]|uniref:polysaccharide pyruvyl transferase family protein n=1 Tax=Variovorax flavidus TaxID=3053501 RepID=UPI00257650C6|nr:polysaccharide pyruvyl transferase family protein [Variovorax sp. J2P1-59]MDM0073090.1 polysaccharide pyruvyl transferase family protein [Variovorax sp. J2P1-59]